VRREVDASKKPLNAGSYQRSTTNQALHYQASERLSGKEAGTSKNRARLGEWCATWCVSAYMGEWVGFRVYALAFFYCATFWVGRWLASWRRGRGGICI
jgi:hypothetical protein